MKIESIKPFTVDGVTYTHQVDGVLFADSIAAAQIGHVALKSLPEELSSLLINNAQNKGLLLLFDSRHEVIKGAAGSWDFATDYLRKGRADIREFLRDGTISIPGRQGNQIYDGAMLKCATSQQNRLAVQSQTISGIRFIHKNHFPTFRRCLARTPFSGLI